MKTLRIARIEVEFIVRAETDEEAREIAYDVWSDETITVNSLDFEIMPMRYYPDRWSPVSLVYGDHPEDLTVGACIAAGEAPEYTKAISDWRAGVLPAPKPPVGVPTEPGWYWRRTHSSAMVVHVERWPNALVWLENDDQSSAHEVVDDGRWGPRVPVWGGE